MRFHLSHLSPVQAEYEEMLVYPCCDVTARAVLSDEEGVGGGGDGVEQGGQIRGAVGRTIEQYHRSAMENGK